MKGAYVSSFGGFIPATDPKFVIFVMVDHPKQNSYYGSQVAAPLFSRLASYAVRREGIAPVLLSEKNFIDKETASPLARKKGHRKNPAALVSKETKKQMQNLQNPVLPEPQTVTASQLIQQASVPEAQVVPDLNRLSMREVFKQISGQDLQLKFHGNGLVSETIPAAGSPMPANKKIMVFLKPAEEIRTR
jgi:cell division protein FtsI (penicillin-binding protein 3)